MATPAGRACQGGRTGLAHALQPWPLRRANVVREGGVERVEAFRMAEEPAMI